MQWYEEGTAIALLLTAIALLLTNLQHCRHLRIDCKKNWGVLVRLMQALESIQLEFHNASVSSVDGHMIKTAIVKIKELPGPMEADALKGAILEPISK